MEGTVCPSAASCSCIRPKSLSHSHTFTFFKQAQVSPSCQFNFSTGCPSLRGFHKHVRFDGRKRRRLALRNHQTWSSLSCCELSFYKNPSKKKSSSCFHLIFSFDFLADTEAAKRFNRIISARLNLHVFLIHFRCIYFFQDVCDKLR